MTTTTAPDTDTLHQLDWDWVPACESRNCPLNNPTATHMIIPLACPCLPTLICHGCAEWWANVFRKNMSGPALCAICDTKLKGHIQDWFRIEPLP